LKKLLSKMRLSRPLSSPDVPSPLRDPSPDLFLPPKLVVPNQLAKKLLAKKLLVPHQLARRPPSPNAAQPLSPLSSKPSKPNKRAASSMKSAKSNRF
jgi:hypothetical protein